MIINEYATIVKRMSSMDCWALKVSRSRVHLVFSSNFLLKIVEVSLPMMMLMPAAPSLSIFFLSVHARLTSNLLPSWCKNYCLGHSWASSSPLSYIIIAINVINTTYYISIYWLYYKFIYINLLLHSSLYSLLVFKQHVPFTFMGQPYQPRTAQIFFNEGVAGDEL